MKSIWGIRHEITRSQFNILLDPKTSSHSWEGSCAAALKYDDSCWRSRDSRIAGIPWSTQRSAYHDGSMLTFRFMRTNQ